MGFSIASVFPWRLFGGEELKDADGVQWKRLVDSAKAAPYYADKNPVKAGPVELAEFYRRYKDFRNPHAARAAAQPLHTVWTPRPRVVALRPWFPMEEGVEVVMRPVCDGLMEMQPEALAGPVDVLRGVAQAILQRRLKLSSLRYGVVAFTGVSRQLLTQPDRDLFWWAFQVPVIEQFRGFGGELLAADCELRDGLHTVAGAAQWESRPPELLVTSFGNLRYPVVRLATGLTGWIDSAPCACGKTTPRLRNISFKAPRAFRAAAS